jgi:hypothetical protein
LLAVRCDIGWHRISDFASNLRIFENLIGAFERIAPIGPGAAPNSEARWSHMIDLL